VTLIWGGKGRTRRGVASKMREKKKKEPLQKRVFRSLNEEKCRLQGEGGGTAGVMFRA